MQDFIEMPRRHSKRTVVLLVLWYGGVGVLGALTALVGAGYLAAVGGVVTPARFIHVLLAASVLPAGFAAYVWHTLVHNRIKADRQAAHEAVDQLLRRRKR
jgi:hypothetical protein